MPPTKAPANDAQLTLSLLTHLREEVGFAVLAPLSHQEQLFVAHYLAEPELRQDKAAIAAGYSKRRAKQKGYELMGKPEVRRAVDAAITARAARMTVTADRVLREVDTVALSSIDHYEVDWDRQRIRLTEDAPPDAMRAVASVKFKCQRRPGTEISDLSCEIRLWGKPETLRLAMQHRGMLVEKHEVTLPPGTGVLRVPELPSADVWQATAVQQQETLAAHPAPEVPAVSP